MVTEEQVKNTKIALNYYARLVNSPAVRETLNLGEKLFLLTYDIKRSFSANLKL